MGGFKVLGLGFSVLGSGFWGSRFGIWVLSFGLWVLTDGFWILGSGRGQPLQYTLLVSFGDIPWFDVQGETWRRDWSRNALFCMCPVSVSRVW